MLYLLNTARRRGSTPTKAASSLRPNLTSHTWRRTPTVMDGKGRCLDNVFVERLWRTTEYEEALSEKLLLAG